MYHHYAVQRIWVVSSAILFLCLAIVGCHQEDSAKSQPIKKSAAKSLAGQRVNFLVIWTQVGAAEALADWFKEETGATVRIIKVDYQDLIQATLDDFNAANPQVDVMMIWYVNLGRLVEEGAIVNLDEFYSRRQDTLQAKDFIPYIFDSYTSYKGSRWSVPFDGDIHVLFYRKSIFARHNLMPPATWDQYTAAARLITEKESANGIYGTAIMAHPTPILIVSSFMNRLGGFGGKLMDEKMTPQINSPEAVAALTALVEQSAYALPTPLETDFSVSRDAFLQGQVAMVEQWTDIGIMAEDERQSFIRGDWGVVAMPRGSGPKARQSTALNAGFTLGLSGKAPNSDVAIQFLAFASRPDTCLRLNLIPGGGGIDPTRKSVVRSSAFKKFAPAISKVEADMLEGHMVVWPNHPEVPALMKILSDGIVAALEKRLTPKAALDKCQRKWTRIVDQHK